jgi:DNA-binding IclR family transcriptional regulator
MNLASGFQIIELLRNTPRGLSRSNLLQPTNMSIDALDESLKSLESKGMIQYVMELDAYMLKAITHSTE